MPPTGDLATGQSVIARREGRAGRITLDRPRALNALDLGMIRAIDVALETWRDDPSVHFLVLDSTSDRAFCVGGDVRVIRDAVLAADWDFVDAYFIQEYALNGTIARYPKPVVSLIDGLWMGGGVGLAVHGAYRVVTERAQFAMPEVQIGLFPDVGTSYVLPRVRGAFGYFLALTGQRVGGADACWLGLATHFAATIEGLADALSADGLGALHARCEPPPEPSFAAIARPVDAAFGHGSVEEILSALRPDQSDWAKTTLGAMSTASPSALRWTLGLMQGGARRTLEACLRAEFELTQRVTRHPDFAEGVRAAVIDKDRQPRWQPVAETIAPTAATG